MLNQFGLLMNLIGSVFVACSVGKNPEEAHQENPKGRITYLAAMNHPKLFRVGIVLLITGFFAQLWASW